MPHCEVSFVPNTPSDHERFNTQWNGWLYRDGCQQATDASDWFNLNTGCSSVEVMNYAYLSLETME